MEAVTFVLCCTLLVFVYRARQSRSVVSKVPGPSSPTLAAHVLLKFVNQTREIPFRLTPACFEKYGDVFHVNVHGSSKIFVRRAQDAAAILHGKKNPNRSEDYQNVTDVLGQGIIGSNGQIWHDHRKVLTPLFHSTNLRKFQPNFHKSARALVDELRHKISTVICPRSIIHDHVVDVVAGTLINFEMSLDDKTELYHVLKESSTVLALRILSYLKIKCLYLFSSAKQTLEQHREWSKQLTLKVLKQWKWKLDSHSFPSDNDKIDQNLMTQLQHLITRDNCEISTAQEQLRCHLMNLAAAGIETSSVAISSVLYMLGLHPELQEQVYREISDVLGDDEHPSIQQLSEMKMLDRCVKETLRLYPVLSHIERVLSEDTKLGEYTIPAGHSVCVSVYDLHRNPQHWPDPETFDPDRFSPENCEKRHPFAYLPFSTGSRNCIGQTFAMLNMKYFLCAILSNLRVEAAVPREHLKLEFNITSFPKSGYLLRLHDRAA